VLPHFSQRAERQLAVSVADALPARDPAAVVPFDRGSLVVAALSWADGDTAWTDANCGVGVVPPTVPIIAVVAVPPDLNINALSHLDAFGFGRGNQGNSRQHRCGCRYGKSDFHHWEFLLGIEEESVTGADPEGSNKGHDTRALQAYLGHKNIQHTVRYTELAPDRFKDFWR
jgi:hypothetical protein